MTRHSLHNYLALTGMTLEVVLRDLGTAADPSILSWPHGLQHVTDLMAHTVRRLGATPALEPEHLAFERVTSSPVCGGSVTSSTARPSANSSRCTWRRSGTSPPCGPTVWRGRVLTNLLSNAIKYSPPGKTIRVTLEGDATGVTCAIQDEGPGLDAAEQAQLFQRGVRLSPHARRAKNHTATAWPWPGTPRRGRGLALVSECAGPGACFAFRLPAAPAGEAEPAWA